MQRFFIPLLLVLLSQPGYAVEEDWTNAATIKASDLPADPPRFEDFPARPLFKGKPAAPDVRSHPRSRMFRTMIRYGAKAGANFAGHYSIVRWGCGSGCLMLAIVDEKTGHVYHPENLGTVDFTNIDFDTFAKQGSTDDLVTYHPDSKLISVIGAINEDSGLRGISYFVWENNKLRRIRFVHKPYE